MLRLRHIDRGWCGLGGDALEILLHLLERFGHLKVAHQRHHGVVGGVIDAEELLDVVDRGRLQISHGADGGVLVAEVVVGEVVDLQFGLAVRLVVDAQPALVLHGVPLIVEIGLVDGQRAHPVAFEVKREVELVLGKLLEIVGAVFVGRAVHAAAVVQDQDEVLTLADVFGPLEHHVLKKMGEARPPGPLIARAHVVSDGNGKDRGRMIGRDDHSQSVRQALLHEVLVRDRRPGRR